MSSATPYVIWRCECVCFLLCLGCGLQRTHGAGVSCVALHFRASFSWLNSEAAL
jgi:hypothetical protein